MEKTNNLDLVKPSDTDAPDINVINTNMDKIDSAYKEMQDDMKEVFQSVSDGKELVASAITDKGILTKSDATFQTMADNIHNISGGISNKVNIFDSVYSSTNTINSNVEWYRQ